MSALEGFPVVVRFPLHWGEMDALGHVNNARFFTWFESARIALFTRVGILADKPRDVGPILATTSCDFLVPVVYPGDISVGARVVKVGTTSLSIDYAVFRDDAPGRPCARGSSVVVLVDYKSGTKVPVPDAIRAAIDKLQPVSP